MKTRKKEVLALSSLEQYNSLVCLCEQATFEDLHSLVDELHLRRTLAGLTLADFQKQAQIKALIHLVHLHGERDVLKLGEKQPNLELMSELKSLMGKASFIPDQFLTRFLAQYDLSWRDLLTLFALFLGESRVRELLGQHLPKIKTYLEFNRLIYLYFLQRAARFHKAKYRARQYVLREGELKQLLEESKCTGEEELVREMPLLPLKEGARLLSPELLYDDLVHNYLQLQAELTK